jgi:hypothetical protein
MVSDFDMIFSFLIEVAFSQSVPGRTEIQSCLKEPSCRARYEGYETIAG